MGWIAFWGFAGRAVIAGAAIYLGADALETARAIWAQ